METRTSASNSVYNTLQTVEVHMETHDSTNLGLASSEFLDELVVSLVCFKKMILKLS